MTIRTNAKTSLAACCAAALIGTGAASASAAPHAGETGQESQVNDLQPAPTGSLELAKIFNGGSSYEGTLSYDDDPGGPDDGRMTVVNWPGGVHRMEATLFWNDGGIYRAASDRFSVPDDHSRTVMAGNPPVGQYRVTIYFYDANGVWEGTDHFYGYNAG